MLRCEYCGARPQDLALPDQSLPWRKKIVQHHGNCAAHREENSLQHVDVLIRPSWDEIFIQFAHLISKRSSCRRLQVGCVVVSDDSQRVLAIGYNGNHRGGSNDCDSSEPGSCGCIHSEMNCLVKLDYNDPSQKVMYLTDSPCKACAKLIVNAGIRHVVYDREYRRTEGVELLRGAKINVRKYTKE